MKFLAKATPDGGLDFDWRKEKDESEGYNRRRFKDFLKKNPGILIDIAPKANPVSDQMRGYIFGALVPFMRQIDPGAWESMDDDQIYEVLKKNFNYFEAFNPLTKRVERYGQSLLSTGKKNKKAMEFIMRVGEWVLENYGMTLPDPEEYKQWRDNAPLLTEPNRENK